PAQAADLGLTRPSQRQQPEDIGVVAVAKRVPDCAELLSREHALATLLRCCLVDVARRIDVADQSLADEPAEVAAQAAEHAVGGGRSILACDGGNERGDGTTVDCRHWARVQTACVLGEMPLDLLKRA